MPGEVAWTVAAYDEADKLELQGKGPMGTSMRTLYDLEEADGGTRIAYEAEFGGAALAAMAGPLEKESAQGRQRVDREAQGAVRVGPATALSRSNR